MLVTLSVLLCSFFLSQTKSSHAIDEIGWTEKCRLEEKCSKIIFRVVGEALKYYSADFFPSPPLQKSFCLNFFAESLQI